MAGSGYWVVGTAAVVVGFIIAYVFAIRPWHMRWGTIGDEARRPLSGDHFISRPKANATHGITIHASAAAIWPWLVQVGQGRGGFYSYDWLENLFGCDIHNTDLVLPEFQHLELGDGVKLHPRAPALSVLVLEPNHALVIGGGRDLQPDLPRDPSFLKLHRMRSYTWAFVLVPHGENATRFLARVHADWDGNLINFVRNRLFLEPAHSIMQEKMNRGLKHCVEAGLRTTAAEGKAS